MRWNIFSMFFTLVNITINIWMRESQAREKTFLSKGPNGVASGHWPPWTLLIFSKLLALLRWMTKQLSTIFVINCKTSREIFRKIQFIIADYCWFFPIAFELIFKLIGPFRVRMSLKGYFLNFTDPIHSDVARFSRLTNCWNYLQILGRRKAKAYIHIYKWIWC